MRRFWLLSSLVVGTALAPAVASAEVTLKPITIVGRPARPAVVIEVRRAAPNVGLRPLAPPQSFFSSQAGTK